MQRSRFRCLWVVLALALMVPGAAMAATVGAKVQTVLQSLSARETIPVIVTLTDQGKDLISSAGAAGARRGAGRLALLKKLKAQAQREQASLRGYLQQQGVTNIQSLWLVNALAFRATPAQIDTIAAMPEVASVTLNGTVSAPVTPPTTPVATLQALAATSVSWNIAALNAPALWNLGDTGQGVVVALLDTGVDYAGNTDLQAKWRTQGGWFDPSGMSTIPYDYAESSLAPDFGHGTAVAGLILGESGIGVAPGAQWIAAKIFKQGSSTTNFSDIHAAFQWLLDPDGNPNTDDMPDIVNGSWGLDEINQCDKTYETDVQNLKALGIAVVFSAGNNGPDSSTSISPGNYPESLAVGAVDSSENIANFSSRGPSACGGAMYPQVVAPGVSVTSFGLDGSSATVDGTSFSAPEVVGILALLRNAYPDTPMATLEKAVEESATPLSPSPDNTYGYGFANALAAYNLLGSTPPTLSVYRRLSFGSVPVGSSHDLILTLKDIGTEPLALGQISNASSSPFTITSDSCSNQTLSTILTGSPCTVKVSFHPTVHATESGNLAIPSDDPASPKITIALTGVGNSLPVPTLTAPVNNATGVARPVTVQWLHPSDADGDTVTDSVVISPHADFSLSQTFPATSASLSGSLAAASGGGLILGALLAGLGRRRRTLLVVLLLLGGSLLLFSCGGGGGGGSSSTSTTVPGAPASLTLSVLSPATTYYWKVVSSDGFGESESEVWHFTTQ